MRIALLTTDGREFFRTYEGTMPTFGTAPQALLEGLAEIPNIEVHVVACSQQPLQSVEKLADNIRFHSVHVPKIGWMRTGYLGCAWAVRRKLRVICPDIVHGQGTERDCAINAVLSGYPNVVTVHGNMNAIADLHHARIGSFHWLAARLEDFTLRRTGGIICISDYVRNLVERYGAPTWIVPNAIQKMFFDFPRESTAPLERPLLINIGVVSERKRQQQLLTLLASLREEGLLFDTIFVGGNPADAYAQEFQAQLRAASQQHGGFEYIQQKLDDASFCRLMDHASAMIHFSNEESFGLTFAEAIARGLFLFASDVGAARDIAEGAEGVRIFGMDQWNDLKDSVRKWIVAGEYKKPRPPKPPPEFIRKFNPASVAKRHVEIYRELLSNRA